MVITWYTVLPGKLISVGDKLRLLGVCFRQNNYKCNLLLPYNIG